MRLEISNLHDKRMRTIRLSIDDQLCHDNRMIRRLPQRTNPPLGRRQMRRVHDEGLILRTPRRRRLQTTHVGAVAQFGLRVTTNDLVVLRPLEEQLVLLRCSLISQCNL